MPTSTGLAQGEAVYEQLKVWDCESRVVGLICDTTSSNTGKDKGAMVRLNRLLKVPLFYLACRHHISELLAKNPYEASFGKSAAPDVKMFLKIKQIWPEVDTSLQVRTVKIPEEKKVELIQLFTSLLEKGDFIRGDYLELAEISVVMLGGKLPGDKQIRWRKPGATHKARFMAFGLLILKIWAFSLQQVVKDNCLSELVDVKVNEGEEEGKRKAKKKKTKKSFVFSPEEEERVERFCVYALSFYIPTFFTSSRGCDAPSNDLKLYKELLEFREIDPTVASAALATMNRHGWYLAPSVVMFSLFSDNVPDDTKARMAARLLELEKPEETRVDLPKFPIVTGSSELWDFVQPNSWEFFDILKIEADWLAQPPVEWEESEDFKKARQFVRTVKVVNDAAERGIKLASDYAQSLTKDSEMKKKILQTVEWHRREMADIRKSTVNK